MKIMKIYVLIIALLVLGYGLAGAQTRYTTVTTTIANGASLSAEVDLLGYKLACIFMPATWTAANLTFSASNATGGTFNDLYDDTGTEVNVTAAAARTICVDFLAGSMAPLRYIKVRSGTTGTPVAQGGARTIILLLKD